MGNATTGLSAEQLARYEADGFVKIEGFADLTTCEAMLDRVVAIARARAAGEDVGKTFVLPENNLRGTAGRPEELVAKIFRLHRDSVFREFAIRPNVATLVRDLIGATGAATWTAEPPQAPPPASSAGAQRAGSRPRGPLRVVGREIECFLSQFIFKNPGAWGQPWHQDSYYFHFTPARPICGVWLAVTEATLENGCLHVLPGSHHEPIHEHVPDRRPDALVGYVEIVDHDMEAAVPVLMQPGDLLLFDSHLMHRSTDNVSDGIRAAMVYHYCQSGTVDHRDGITNDFMPIA